VVRVGVLAAPRGREIEMRIVALSDQHGHLPEVPRCDLLIVAGDICPDRMGVFYAKREPEQQKAWFDRCARPWLADAPAAHRIGTWGNHDWCGQSCDFSADFPDRAPSSRFQLLVDQATRIPSSQTAGPLAIWGTPWSNPFMDWAFMKDPAELARLYAAIPAGIDVLVSHQPPYGYGDLLYDRDGSVRHLGSHELLAAIDRVRPRLVICGHFHEGRGRYDCHGVPIYNVSVVDQQYNLVHPVTVIDLPA
jgi:3',5'-cyclic AMP phosphodiesterase CpdA